MTSRELVVKTLNHQPVPRIPRDLWVSADGDSDRTDELNELGIRYPSDIITPVGPAPQGKPPQSGEYVDAWGCVWQAGANGSLPVLTQCPLANSGKIASYQPPAEVLELDRFTKADKACATTNRFVLAWSEVRPFDRLRMLRGDEAVLMDLAAGKAPIRRLLAMIHELACKELELWAKTEVDGVVFRDDWATAEGMHISTEMWREIFRPLYRDYCTILHDHDKFVFFHGDGNIVDIFGELAKLGVDAIHGQLSTMNVERLAKRYCGHVTFWGGLDHTLVQWPGAGNEFRSTVLAVRQALDAGAGGVIAQCPWDHDTRLQTVAAYFEQWLTPMPMRV